MLISQSPGVIPVESPTVPKADVTSNISGRKAVCGSKMHRRKVPAHTTSRERKAMRYAFEIPSAGIVRRKAPNGFFVMRLLTDWIRTKKVLVLIPPPVEPGEAPMNMRRTRVNRPAFENSPMG